MTDRKKLRNDVLLIISLLLVATVTLIILLTRVKKTNLVAKISVENHVVQVVDLSKKEDKHFYIEGTHGKLHIHTHNGAIAVVESNCPHQDCVKMGYIDSSGHPIICAYNEVTIVIDGKSSTFSDAELG